MKFVVSVNEHRLYFFRLDPFMTPSPPPPPPPPHCHPIKPTFFADDFPKAQHSPPSSNQRSCSIPGCSCNRPNRYSSIHVPYPHYKRSFDTEVPHLRSPEHSNDRRKRSDSSTPENENIEHSPRENSIGSSPSISPTMKRSRNDS